MNFLIGRGELLTAPVIIKKGGGDTNRYPYTLDEALDRLLPQFESSWKVIEALPSLACPYDLAVQLVTLNPDYLAKSHYPNSLFRSLDVYPIGSRSRSVVAEKRKTKPSGIETLSTDIYVAGRRDALRTIPNKINKS
jgi:hypothetical protein